MRARAHLPAVHRTRHASGQPVPKVLVSAVVDAHRPFRRVAGVDEPLVLLRDVSIEEEATGAVSFVDHMHVRVVGSKVAHFQQACGAEISFRAHLSRYTRADGSKSWTLRGLSRVRQTTAAAEQCTPEASDLEGAR